MTRKQVISRIPEEIFPSSKITERQLSSRGGPKTKLITLEDAIELVMALPGKKAKLIRKGMVNIIMRYLDGDRSMCQEILENQNKGRAWSYTKFATKVLSQTQKDVSARTNAMPQVSYVYGTKSNAFPGLIKIGRSVDVFSRLYSLNTGCAPLPHSIIAVVPTLDAKRDEALAHSFFSSSRKEGEFFSITEEEVKTFFTESIMPQYQKDMAECISKAQGDF